MKRERKRDKKKFSGGSAKGEAPKKQTVKAKQRNEAECATINRKPIT